MYQRIIIATIIIGILLYIQKIEKKNYNSILLQIQDDMKYSKRYDIDKYDTLILKLNKFMKVYIYILGERWDPQVYMSTLIELRLEILEVLYSMYMILPKDMKHVFGFNALDRLKDNIDLFHTTSLSMIHTCENFAKIGTKYKYLPDSRLLPANMRNNIMLP
jgi:hypothetical protein